MQKKHLYSLIKLLLHKFLPLSEGLQPDIASDAVPKQTKKLLVSPMLCITQTKPQRIYIAM